MGKSLEDRVFALECANKSLRYELDSIHDIGKVRAKRIRLLTRLAAMFKDRLSALEGNGGE